MADKAAADAADIDDIEHEFQQVLSQLQGDEGLAKFRVEYEKLHDALRRSHDSERRLMAKCRELNAELVANTAKVESVVRGTHDDQSQVASLQKEVDQAWKLVDAARENEAALQDEIETLKEEIAEMSRTLEETSDRPVVQNEDITELLQQKKALTGERDALVEQVAELEASLAEVTEKQVQADKDLDGANQEIETLKEAVLAKKQEAEQEAKRKGNIERQLNATKLEIEAHQQQTMQKQKQVENVQQELAMSQQQTQALQLEIEKLRAEIEAQNQHNRKLEKEVSEGLLANQNATEEGAKLKEELQARQEQLAAAREEVQKLTKLNEGLSKKIKQSDDRRLELEKLRDEAKSQIAAQERDMEALRRQAQSDRKQLEDLARARDMVQKKMQQVGRDAEVQDALVKMHEAGKAHLENEIASFKTEAAKQRAVISQLERERDRHLAESASSHQKSVEALEEVKVAETQVLDYKKKLASVETRLKQQQSLYEAARSDRNLYSKSLIEAQDEISELKRKLKVLNHQIEQLKDEVGSKEMSLMREQQAHEEIEQQKIKLKAEIDALKVANTNQTKAVKEQVAEQDKLRKYLTEAEAALAKKQKELESVITERDLRSTQLVRRNDEVELVYEKLRIQQSTLSKGESQYNQRVEDLKVLKTEIKKLRREKAVLEKSAANVDELKREVFRVQRELMREKTRSRALEEELETPMNVHRWRRLEGSDPETFEMVQKVQALQKRLIAKTEEVVEKEMLLQEKEKQFMELKAVLERQPGPEVAEQLQVYKQAVKDKNRQLKSMASEMNMYQAQVTEYKFEIERLARELTDMKKKYFDTKRRHQETKQLEPARQSLTGPLPSITQQRFGGSLNASQGKNSLNV